MSFSISNNLSKEFSRSPDNSTLGTLRDHSVLLALDNSLGTSYPVINIDYSLYNPISLKRITKYSTLQHSEESILYLIALTDYRACTDVKKLPFLAKSIYESHIKKNCPYEVCLNSNTYKIVTELYANNKIAECFRLVEIEAIITLKNDIFPRFIKTPIYSKLIEELLLSLFSNYTIKNKKKGVSAIITSSTVEEYLEVIPTCQIMYSHPLGHELLKQYVYKLVPAHLNTFSFYDAIRILNFYSFIFILETLKRSSRDIELKEWSVLCQQIFRDFMPYITEKKIMNEHETSALAPKPYKRVKSMMPSSGLNTPSLQVHLDRLHSVSMSKKSDFGSSPSHNSFSSLRSLSPSKNNDRNDLRSLSRQLLKDPDAPMPDAASLSSRRLLSFEIFLSLDDELNGSLENCTKTVFDEAEKYLWQSIELLFVGFIESEIYFNCYSDYQLIRAGDYEKRVLFSNKAKNKAKLAQASIGNITHEKLRTYANIPEEEVPSKTLEEVLLSPSFNELFKAFCKKEYSDESIEAWNDIEKFRKCEDLFKKDQIAKNINNTYFVPGSSMELAVDDHCKALIKTFLSLNAENVMPSIFDQAQRLIVENMRNDSFTRFVKSPAYIEAAKNDAGTSAAGSGSMFCCI